MSKYVVFLLFQFFDSVSTNQAERLRDSICVHLYPSVAKNPNRAQLELFVKISEIRGKK